MLTFAQHSNQGFLNILERHNHLPQFSLYNNGICAAREKTVFPVKNSLNYLVISNNLLLSHFNAPSLISLKNLLSYARVDSGATLINKGLSEVSFVLKSMSVYEDLSFEIRQTLGEKFALSHESYKTFF